MANNSKRHACTAIRVTPHQERLILADLRIDHLVTSAKEFIKYYGLLKTTVIRTVIEKFVDATRKGRAARGFELTAADVCVLCYDWWKASILSLAGQLCREFAQRYSADQIALRFGTEGWIKYCVIFVRHFVIFKDLLRLVYALLVRKVSVVYAVVVVAIAVVDDVAPLYVSVPLYVSIAHGSSILKHIKKFRGTDV